MNDRNSMIEQLDSNYPGAVPTAANPSEVLDNLQRRILTFSLWLITVMSSTGTIYAYSVSNPIYQWFALNAIVVGAMALLKNLSKFVRFAALMLVIYFAAVQDVLVVGAQGSHLTYFILLTFFTATIMGFRFGIGVLVLVMVTYVVVPALVIYSEQPIRIGGSVMTPGQLSSSDDWIEWIRFQIQYFFCANVIVFSMHYLTNQLQRSLITTQQSLGELHSSNASLQVAQADLQKSEAQYRTLADNVRDVVWMSNLDGTPTYISPSIYRQRGYTVEESMNLSLEDTIVPEYIAMVTQALAEELSAEEQGTADPNRSRSIEYEVYRKDGSTTWVESVMTFLRDEHGTPCQILGTTRDISERKSAEEERASLRHQMQEMQKLESLGLLAGGIAHDFNNLLLGIMGNTDLALTNVSAADAAQPFLRNVMKSSEKAAELCNQLLAYSGKGKFRIEPFDLGELVQEMTELLDVSLEKDVVLRLDIADDLESVEGDLTQIRQIILNLIVNAAEAIGGNPGSITITIRSDKYSEVDLDDFVAKEKLPEGSYVVLEISDTGCGMDETTRSRIFDPFFTTKESGHGLGLAAVQGIVYGHDGALRVSSVVDKGTCISVLLPASEKEAVSLDATDRSEIAPDAEGTILVVDDEEIVRDFTRRALEQTGYKVLSARNGQEALDVFQSNKTEIDLVLLDLTMPVMGGEDTHRELQKLSPGLPTIFTSGYSQDDAPSSFENETGFIQKPYRISDLLGKIRDAISDS